MNFSSYISKVKRSLHFLLFTVRDLKREPFVQTLPVRLSRVRVVFVSPLQSDREGFTLQETSAPIKPFFSHKLTHRLVLVFCSSSPASLLRSPNSLRPFSNVVPLSPPPSIQPVSRWKLCCFSFFSSCAVCTGRVHERVSKSFSLSTPRRLEVESWELDSSSSYHLSTSDLENHIQTSLHPKQKYRLSVEKQNDDTDLWRRASTVATAPFIIHTGPPLVAPHNAKW